MRQWGLRITSIFKQVGTLFRYVTYFIVVGKNVSSDMHQIVHRFIIYACSNESFLSVPFFTSFFKDERPRLISLSNPIFFYIENIIKI